MDQTQDRVIYLTFDDGPLEPHTSKILDILKQYNAKAAFFFCGKNIERNAGSVARVVSEGHSLGNHTYSHDFWKVITGNLLGEIEQTELLIKNYANITSLLYRSPWGITLPRLRANLLAAGFAVCSWNITAFDWWQPSAEFIARHVIARAFPGAVVLLHDGNRTLPGNRENTVKALPVIIKALREQGYMFKPLKPDWHNQRVFLKDFLTDIITVFKNY